VRKLILQQDGMALVLALIVMLVLTTGAATAYFYAQSNSRESTQSRAQGDAYHAAEAGLSAAIAVIQNPNNNDQDSTLFGSAGNMTLICVDPNVAAVNGSCPAGQRTWATYGGSLDTSGSASVWTLTAYGYAANTDSQGARPIQHKVSAQIQLQAENDTSAVDDSWSYLFSTQTQSANKACDQTYTTQISTFVYAQGNLCLSGNGEFIDSSSHSTKVEANGYIELQSSTNSFVGTSTNSAVGTVKTNFGCIYSGTTYHPCATSSAHQFIKSSSGTTDGITPPVVDWDAWYRSAAPGPHVNCVASKSSSPSSQWPVFDYNLLRDDTLDKAPYNQIVNLTPNYSYKCWTNNGHIYWDASKDQLQLGGTIFIDGSATIANGLANTYQGYGTIYLSGTFLLGANTEVCAWVVSHGACSSFWSLFGFFVIAANGNASTPNTVQSQGGAVPAGDGIELGAGSTFQGWLYATNNIHAESTTTIMGPMIGNQLQLNSNVTAWQSTWGGQGPSGAPGNEPSNNDANTPMNFTG